MHHAGLHTRFGGAYAINSGIDKQVALRMGHQQHGEVVVCKTAQLGQLAGHVGGGGRGAQHLRRIGHHMAQHGVEGRVNQVRQRPPGIQQLAQQLARQ